MALKVLAIAGDDLSSGFALSGIETAKARDAFHAGEVLLQAVEGSEYGIIIVEESFVDDFDIKTKELVFEGTIPLIMPISGEMKWQDVEEVKEDDYLAALIRRAVGYQLNVKL